MHAVENIDIYIHPSQCKRCYRGQEREAPGESRNRILDSPQGVGHQERERHITVVWLYPASESRVTRSITSKPQLPIETRFTQAFLFSRESYSLPMRRHQRKQVERYVRHVSHIQQLDSQTSWEYSSVPHPTISIRWLSPILTLSSHSRTSLKRSAE